jgi:hypothetical protein
MEIRGPKKNTDNSMPTQHNKKSDEGGAFATASTRQLEIIAGCTILGQFDMNMRLNDMKTLVEKQKEWRAKG